jgi:hypothetical protein
MEYPQKVFLLRLAARFTGRFCFWRSLAPLPVERGKVQYSGRNAMSTVRCTMAQALVRYLCNQFTVIDGEKVPLFPGVFAIFGHGNVTCLSEALEAVKDVLPTWRGKRNRAVTNV